MATSGIGRRRAAAQQGGNDAYFARRQEIIDAAAVVFKKRGFQGTSLGDVARELKTDRANLYYYVGSKEEVFDEAVTKAVEENLERLKVIRDSPVPAPEKLRTMIEELMVSYEKYYPFLYVFIQENLNHAGSGRTAWARKMKDVNKSYEQITTGIVQAGYDDSTLRNVGPAWVVAFGVIGVVAWTNRWFDPTRSEASAQDIGKAYADMLLVGLKPEN
jgi:AcrR family transcriptional regulator